MIARWFGKNAGQEAAVEAAALRSDRFRQAREGDWQRLDAIVTRIEGGRLRKLSDEDLLALPALYRTAVSSLAIARETSLDAALIAYLEGLARRAWFAVYGPREGLGAWLRRFFLGGWSAAVRAMGIDLVIALAVMVLGTVVVSSNTPSSSACTTGGSSVSYNFSALNGGPISTATNVAGVSLGSNTTSGATVFQLPNGTVGAINCFSNGTCSTSTVQLPPAGGTARRVGWHEVN